ncbi:NADP-dependent oxidoreductase domain-containing protein [Xylaria bambusicola]|uniref:NADP-dependent oxidoreductase domain-containing protein n=1 Tax=Xylaria bambusicola TaxID=326684 RepID=UPI002008D80E|nr:NADP-dependent oxidoreductase domain-containing protein [Xylaria bambusicola]KAI0509391.1 NADP-dependent oxidoreductase domain-containing protein [Xylaria bambusicola]
MTSTNPLSTNPVGLGLMAMTWWVKQTHDKQAFGTMKAAIRNGATFWSSAAFYGTADPAANLSLIRRYFEKYPEDASKSIKGSNKQQCCTRASVENTLRILGGAKDIDIFSPSRSDPKISTERTFTELKALVNEGNIKGVGLSEVGSKTIKRAHAAIHLCAVEVEFSLWSTEILTNGVAATCKSLNIPIIAYSPLGRGFLTGQLKNLSDVPAGDVRLHFDGFQPKNFETNLELVSKLDAFAGSRGVTTAQLALAWGLANSDSAECGTIVPIPGATTTQRVEENTKITGLSAEDKAELNAIVNSVPITGGRYNEYLEKGLWG